MRLSATLESIRLWPDHRFSVSDIIEVGPLIILLEPGWAEGQICPDRIWLIWSAFVQIPEVGSGFWPICPDV
jgi:hypothetical protein